MGRTDRVSRRPRGAARLMMIAVLWGMVLAIACSAAAWGQDPPHHERAGRHDPPGPPGAPAPPTPPQELLGAVRAWRLVEVLDLPEDKIPEVVAKLMTMDKTEREFRLGRRQSLERMAQLVEEPSPDQAALRRELKQLRDDEEAFRRQTDKLRGELLNSLSLEQQVRLHVFEERFPHEMRRLIHRLRGGDQPGPAPEGRGPESRRERRSERRERLRSDVPPDVPPAPSPEGD